MLNPFVKPMRRFPCVTTFDSASGPGYASVGTETCGVCCWSDCAVWAAWWASTFEEVKGMSNWPLTT